MEVSMTNLNNRRFTLAPGRPAACVYRLPVRAAPVVVQPTPLRLDWSPDPATGVPVARWVRDEEEAASRCAPPRRVFRLAA
ncbi:hypothetical protein DAH96_01240 [Sphingomonas koreensis]|jgi:hypothetical protein|uniref:Uncharacterized protein n=2 Tax=Sphingomonas koreensis TaxID=93064 RepID=A0A1L6J963_9SPHN|nr:hypothetical protein BRX40_08380 [Sphingomonas koreensis]RSU26452.1 hypothetical protein CA222_09130 [Sphingomonas koreensis]RSU27234.1 hypothetical protein CA225_10815 [Sphingomonas koreensis]RSU32718.1 hypothetical protein BRX39_15420 [Sphingomonas koreensis]RSU41763.1 hypothetical protein BRX38_07625 [Sphingomonas koreensis]